jgi:hypothetical protein
MGKTGSKSSKRRSFLVGRMSDLSSRQGAGARHPHAILKQGTNAVRAAPAHGSQHEATSQGNLKSGK